MNGIDEMWYFFGIFGFNGNHVTVATIAAMSQPQKDALPAIWNLQSESKIKEYVNQVDCYQDVEIYDGKEKYCIQMVIRGLVIQTEWIECTKGKCELYLRQCIIYKIRGRRIFRWYININGYWCWCNT